MTTYLWLSFFVVGCVGEPPRPSSTPELRLIATAADGEAVMLAAGDALDLGPLSNDCPTTHSVRLVNVGTREANVTLSSDTAELQLGSSQVTLGVGLEATVPLTITTTTQGVFSAQLRVEHEGATRSFLLRGLVVSGESDWPSKLDFGGVEVGSSATLQGLELTGVTSPFTSVERAITFAPTEATHVEQRVTISRRAGCVSPGLRLVGDGVARQLSGPAAVELGAVPLGSSRTSSETIENLAMLPVHATLEGSSDFVVSERSTTLATRGVDGGVVAGEVTVDVSFTPSAVTSRTATLVLTSGTARLRIPVQGAGQ